MKTFPFTDIHQSVAETAMFSIVPGLSRKDGNVAMIEFEPQHGDKQVFVRFLGHPKAARANGRALAAFLKRKGVRFDFGKSLRQRMHERRMTVSPAGFYRLFLKGKF